MMLARDLIIPVVPAARRATIREARIDVAIAAPAGDARQALAIGAVRAVARIAPTAALKAIGIIVRGRRTGARYRRGAGCQVANIANIALRMSLSPSSRPSR